MPNDCIYWIEIFDFPILLFFWIFICKIQKKFLFKTFQKKKKFKKLYCNSKKKKKKIWGSTIFLCFAFGEEVIGG